MIEQYHIRRALSSDRHGKHFPAGEVVEAAALLTVFEPDVLAGWEQSGAIEPVSANLGAVSGKRKAKTTRRRTRKAQGA